MVNSDTEVENILRIYDKMAKKRMTFRDMYAENASSLLVYYYEE